MWASDLAALPQSGHVKIGNNRLEISVPAFSKKNPFDAVRALSGPFPRTALHGSPNRQQPDAVPSPAAGKGDRFRPMILEPNGKRLLAHPLCWRGDGAGFDPQWPVLSSQWPNLSYRRISKATPMTKLIRQVIV
jgi:hypothetical protein